jgi:hypothetical protein
LAEDLAHRALDQLGETLVPCRRSVLARMARQQPRRPQLVRIAMVPCLVTRQGDQEALMLNPRHRSAHEHFGEAYLVLGDPATAEQHLAHLEDICLIGCEEYDDLKRAIAGYKRLVAR